MSDFRKYLDEQLKDEEFKKEWEDSVCEYGLVEAGKGREDETIQIIP